MGKSVQAAKKEGQLVNYGGEEITHPEILKAFNKDYPEIKVTTAGGHGSELGARILAERRADKLLVDLYTGGPTTPYRVLYLSKALDPITPLFLFPEITDQSKWFTGKHIYADPDNRYLFLFEGSVSGGATIYVNTRHVNTAEFKSYWDLLQPKWRGKILFMDPKSSSLGLNAATSLFNDPDLGPEFLKRLFGEMRWTWRFPATGGRERTGFHPANITSASLAGTPRWRSSKDCPWAKSILYP